MPIRINLLEEEQKAKLARQRDPVMLTTRFSALGVCLVLAVSVILFTRERALKEQFVTLQTEWRQRQPQSQKIYEQIHVFEKLVAKTDVVRTQLENRFLWAPQLELYKDVIPSTVQITRYVGRREVTTPAPPAPGTNGPAPKPTQTVKVTMEGIVEGSRPELIVNDFLMILKSNPRLAEQVAEIRLVSLTKGSGPLARTDAAKAEPGTAPEQTTARFVIEVQYKQKPIKRA